MKDILGECLFSCAGTYLKAECLGQVLPYSANDKIETDGFHPNLFIYTYSIYYQCEI